MPLVSPEPWSSPAALVLVLAFAVVLLEVALVVGVIGLMALGLVQLE